MKNIILSIVIVIISIAVSATAYKIYHRFDLGEKLSNRTNSAYLWIQNQNLTPSPFDKKVGRKPVMHERGLFKVNETFDISVVSDQGKARNFSVRSNN